MALIELYDVAQAPSFRNRLVACIVQTAGNVFNEEEKASANNIVYQKRQNLAQQAVIDPHEVAQRFVWPMLSNPVIAKEGIGADDDALAYQCAQVWNTVAGVTPYDTQLEA